MMKGETKYFQEVSEVKNSKIALVAIVVLCLAAVGIVVSTLVGSGEDDKEKEVISEKIQSTDQVPEEEQPDDKALNETEAEAVSETETGSEANTEEESESSTGEVKVAVPDGNWSAILQPEIKQTVRMAAFLNESFGVTGGYSSTGKTHYTNDGGATWTKNEESGGCLYGIEVVDPNVVWVCGRMKGVSFRTPGGLRASTDGGKTLGDSSNYETVPGECPLSFLDDKRGWISQNNKVSETVDGGLNFTEISLPEGIGKIRGIGVYEQDGDMAGCVLSEDGTLCITRDHGVSWTKSTLPLKEKYDSYKPGKFESVPAAIRFFDKDNALVVISLVGDGEPLIIGFRTADGGMTWTDELIGKGHGSIYLSPDGHYVTSYNAANKITVYRLNKSENNEE